MRSAALATAFLCAGLWANGAACPAGEYDFAEPGQTTVGEALRRRGEPSRRYPAELVAGELDVSLMPRSPASVARIGRARARGAEIVDVLVLQWWVSDLSYATFVFRGDTLWYAVHPASRRESIRARALYGGTPLRFERGRRIGCIGYTLEVQAYPEKGVAFVRGAEGEIDEKVVFPPGTWPLGTEPE